MFSSCPGYRSFHRGESDFPCHRFLDYAMLRQRSILCITSSDLSYFINGANTSHSAEYFLVWIDCISLDLTLHYGIVVKHNDVLEVVVQDRKAIQTLWPTLPECFMLLKDLTVSHSLNANSIIHYIWSNLCYTILIMVSHITDLYTGNSMCSRLYRK